MKNQKWGIFRTLSNSYDVTFLRKYLTAKNQIAIFFSKNFHHKWLTESKNHLWYVSSILNIHIHINSNLSYLSSIIISKERRYKKPFQKSTAFSFATFWRDALQRNSYPSNMIGFPHCDITLLAKLQPGGLQSY